MAVEKIWKCDLCGEFTPAGTLRRVAVRLISDRPDGADWVDVGEECHGKLIGDLLAVAAEERRVTEHGE